VLQDAHPPRPFGRVALEHLITAAERRIAAHARPDARVRSTSQTHNWAIRTLAAIPLGRNMARRVGVRLTHAVALTLRGCRCRGSRWLAATRITGQRTAVC
jgi:hypothetical protein